MSEDHSTSEATETHGRQTESRTHPMQHGHRPAAAAQAAASLVPETGWHFLHLFYRVDRDRLRGFTDQERRDGRAELIEALGVRSPGALEQLQCFAVPGHKADFGVMLAGPDLKAVHGVQMAIQASRLGPALMPTYSFYSITEVSEYVPDVEAYGKILRERENVDPESSLYKTKVTSYADRLESMNRQRLYPDFMDWPCLCFYPMSKMRSGDQNWYLLAVRGAVGADGPARQERDEVRGQSQPDHHRLDRSGRLGVGCHALGPQSRSISRTSFIRCGSTRARPSTPCSATSTSATSCRRVSCSRSSGYEHRTGDERARRRRTWFWPAPRRTGGLFWGGWDYPFAACLPGSMRLPLRATAWLPGSWLRPWRDGKAESIAADRTGSDRDRL